MSEATSGAGSAAGKADPGLRFADPGYDFVTSQKNGTGPCVIPETVLRHA